MSVALLPPPRKQGLSDADFLHRAEQLRQLRLRLTERIDQTLGHCREAVNAEVGHVFHYTTAGQSCGSLAQALTDPNRLAKYDPALAALGVKFRVLGHQFDALRDLQKSLEAAEAAGLEDHADAIRQQLRENAEHGFEQVTSEALEWLGRYWSASEALRRQEGGAA